MSGKSEKRIRKAVKAYAPEMVGHAIDNFLASTAKWPLRLRMGLAWRIITKHYRSKP